MNIKRIKLTIEYDGTNYHGWQTQNGLPTIQESIETALKKLFSQDIKTFVAGRTDAEVHAFGQTAHFDIDDHRNYSEWRIMSGINNYLVEEPISIVKVEFVDQDFHSRFSAQQKSYIYKIVNRYSELTLQKNRAWLVRKNVDIKKMIESSKFLIGRHDFSSFKAQDCQSRIPCKTIDEINFTQNKDEIQIEFLGKSFLHNQVRIMVGTLKKIATSDKFHPKLMADILEKKNRIYAGETAPGCGLYLNWIKY
jgi:tRNA pseudouridine38-40 synthase